MVDAGVSDQALLERFEDYVKNYEEAKDIPLPNYKEVGELYRVTK